MTVTLEFFLSIVAATGGGIGAWVAVRADLARAIVKAEAAEKAAEKAHSRIDQLLGERR
jgi:ribosomal protein S9